MQKIFPSITMENETAVFNDGRGHVVRAMPEQLHAVYFVYSGWDVWATDQEFWIVELDNALIIVSDEERLHDFPAWNVTGSLPAFLRF